MSERLEKLLRMLEREPADPFLLYGAAMEYKKQNDPNRAIEFLDRVITADAGYCYAYYQKGQVLESRGNTAAARLAYQDGINAARTKGDAHALEELQAALSMIQ